MIDFFLVEDEAPVRSALREGFPWEAYGFACAGEASDGELALPILRRKVPDLLVTDLHMPFLDGLELCRQVRAEFPGIRLLLLGDGANQEELQTALSLGVDGFLPKPVDHAQLALVLTRLRGQMEREQQLRSELETLRRRSAQWEESRREQLLLQVMEGTQSVQSLHHQAQSLGLDLHAQRYSVLLCVIRPLSTEQKLLGELEEVRRELKLFFSRSPRMHSFAWHPFGFSVLVLSDQEAVEREISFCIQNIRHRMLPLGSGCRWMVSVSEPVNRLRSVGKCCDEALEMLGWACLAPERQVLSRQALQSLRRGELEERLRALPPVQPLHRELELFLNLGTAEQAEELAEKWADSLGTEAMEVPQLCLYVLVRVRLAVARYVYTLNCPPADLLSAVEGMPGIELLVGRSNVVRYLTALLARAAQLRERVSQSRYHKAVQRGLQLVVQNYTDPRFNLAAAAKEAGVSPNYFSALFRREVGVSFSAYLTRQRMELARELLRSTNLSSAQVGAAAGYQDARYFSTQFHKTQGCTPREYRCRERKKG